MNLKEAALRLLLRSHAWWQIFFYLLPLCLLIAISFWTLKNYQLTPAFTLENYMTVFSSSVYLEGLINSLWLASTTSLLAVILGLPVAYTVCFHLQKRTHLITIFSLFLPFFSSYIIRMFSWQLWLNDSGIIASALRKIGLLEGQLGLIYTETAIRIGLLSVLVPIASLIIYLSISRMDKTLVQAAWNLGASPWQSFWRITFPFALPGIIIAFLFSFIISFGDFVSPSILGGNQVYTISTLIEDRVKINDWPTAAALGVVMLIISIAIIAFIFGILRFLPGQSGKSIR